MIGNAHFENAQTAYGGFGDDFRFEAETVLLDWDALDDLAPEHLITGFHIRQVQVGEHVREQREESVAHTVPEIEYPVASAREKPGTDHHVRRSLGEGRN